MKWTVQDYKGSQAQSSLIICAFHIFEFAYLLKCLCCLPINTRLPRFGRLAHAQSSQGTDLPNVHISAQVRQGDAAFFFQLSRCSFRNLLSATFSTFLCFLGWFRCFKRPQSIALKCWLAFLGARRLRLAPVRSALLQVILVRVMLAARSRWINQLYTT